MTPRRANDMIEEYSAELGMEQSQVRSILNQYWTMVQEQLDKKDDIRVRLPKLCTFKANLRPVEKYLKFLSIKKNDKYCPTVEIKRLEMLQFKLKEDQTEAKRIRSLRYAMKNESIKDLEEPEADC